MREKKRRADIKPVQPKFKEFHFTHLPVPDLITALQYNSFDHSTDSANSIYPRIVNIIETIGEENANMPPLNSSVGYNTHISFKKQQIGI